MDILKKNMFSIVFGVIAILACCTLIWPIPQKFAGLRTDLNTRAAIDGKLQNIIGQTHLLPILSPDQQNQDTLTVFPADKVRAAAVAAAGKVADQANNMLNTAIKVNSHDILVPNSLPASDDNMKFKFVQAYLPEISGYARWQKILSFGARATPLEIATRTQQLHDRIFASRIYYTRNAQGVAVQDPASVQQAQTEFNTQSTTVAPEVQLEHAKGFSVYIEPGVLPTDPVMNTDQLPDIARMWDDQVALWYCDDILGMIGRINKKYAGSDYIGGPPVYDVLHSPIKLISRLDRPVSVAGDTTNGPKVMSVISTTGRASNNLYDVLRFKIDMTVDAAKLPQILHEMEVGQFFTVLEVQVLGVQDPAVAASQGYRFGDKPTLNIELDCELLYMKGWTDPFIPPSVKGAYKGAIAPPSSAGWAAQTGSGNVNASDQPSADSDNSDNNNNNNNN